MKATGVNHVSIHADWPDVKTLNREIFAEIVAVPGPSDASVYHGRRN